jgi:aminoglycoside phosphotransferase (APT) family kinase protein
MFGAAPLPPEALAVRDRLLQRLYPLVADTPRRAQVLQEAGGPDTLLHGDLWRVNTFVNITEGEARARLIDWDHTGVGPSSYDLSTFLTRFPPGDRPWILSRYQQAIVRAGWRLPTEQELDTLFETAEYARFANRIAWAAMAWLHDHAEWSPVELAEIERWFEAWRPVLARPGVTS